LWWLQGARAFGGQLVAVRSDIPGLGRPTKRPGLFLRLVFVSLHFDISFAMAWCRKTVRSFGADVFHVGTSVGGRARNLSSTHTPNFVWPMDDTIAEPPPTEGT
jgi:hypothetical protein